MFLEVRILEIYLYLFFLECDLDLDLELDCDLDFDLEECDLVLERPIFHYWINLPNKKIGQVNGNIRK